MVSGVRGGGGNVVPFPGGAVVVVQRDRVLAFGVPSRGVVEFDGGAGQCGVIILLGVIVVVVRRGVVVGGV